MNIPNFELLYWILDNEKKARYNFSNSSIGGIAYSDLIENGFAISTNFDMGKNAHRSFPDLIDSIATEYSCYPEQIITTNGGSEANYIALTALIEPGDEVIVENPGYSPMKIIPQMAGAVVKHWERRFDEGYKLNLDTLKSIISSKTKMVVITNMHNPSGICEEHDKISEIANYLSNRGIYFLIDEIFLHGTTKQSKSAVNLPGVIVTSSLTKVFGLGGLRTGWIIAPINIADQIKKMKSYVSAAGSYLSEHIAAFVLSKMKQQLINRFKAISENNICLIEDFFENNKNHLSFIHPDGGILCFAQYKSNVPSIEFCSDVLRKTNVLINPGIYFGNEYHFRLTFSNPSNIVKEGLVELGKYFPKN